MAKNASNITIQIQIDVKESVIRGTKKCRNLLGNIIDSVKTFCQGDWSDITNLQNAVIREILGKSYWPDQKN